MQHFKAVWGFILVGKGEEVETEAKNVEEFYGKIKIPKELADEIIEMEIWD